MKKNKEKVPSVILLMMDGTIETTIKENFSEDELTFVEYVLIPELDGSSYIMCTPSKYLNIKTAKVKYMIRHYIYEEYAEFEGIKSDSMLDEQTLIVGDESKVQINELEANNAIKLYNILLNALKIKMSNELISTNFDPDFYSGLSILYFDLEVETLDGETTKFHWNAEYGVSIGSNMNNLIKKLIKLFSIPRNKFAYLDNCILIKKNKWEIKNIDKTKDDDLVGVFSNMCSNISFIEKMDYIGEYMQVCNVSIYTFTIEDLIKYDSGYLTKSKYSNYYNDNFDIDNVGSLDCHYCVLTSDNDRLTLFLNIYYFFRYIEATAYAFNKCPIDSIIAVASMEINTKNTKGLSSKYDIDIRFDKYHIPSLSAIREYLFRFEEKEEV